MLYVIESTKAIDQVCQDPCRRMCDQEGLFRVYINKDC